MIQNVVVWNAQVFKLKLTVTEIQSLLTNIKHSGDLKSKHLNVQKEVGFQKVWTLIGIWNLNPIFKWGNKIVGVKFLHQSTKLRRITQPGLDIVWYYRLNICLEVELIDLDPSILWLDCYWTYISELWYSPQGRTSSWNPNLSKFAINSISSSSQKSKIIVTANQINKSVIHRKWKFIFVGETIKKQTVVI